MSFACRRVLTALVASAGIAAAVPVFALEVHDDVEPHHGWNQFPIDVLSSRPDTVSGGDSLIQVGVRKNVALNQMRIKLNGTDVTAISLANNATRTPDGPRHRVGARRKPARGDRSTWQRARQGPRRRGHRSHELPDPRADVLRAARAAVRVRYAAVQPAGGLGNLGAPLDAELLDQPARRLHLSRPPPTP